jgi:flavin-dependent dehydrogenase
MVAIRLATAGRQVTLLEKETTAHHKVCGEFLSPEAVGYLNQVGITPLDLGAATIRFVRLSAKQRVVETALPFTALSLSRFALDEALLSRVEECGCKVQRGSFVEQLNHQDNLWSAQLRKTEKFHRAISIPFRIRWSFSRREEYSQSVLGSSTG